MAEKLISPTARALGDALIKTIQEGEWGELWIGDILAALSYARTVVEDWQTDAEKAAGEYGR